MKVDEIFGPTIQGEGAMAGAVTMFVRLGGCDYRCTWCDTMHAVDPTNAPAWRDMDALAVANEVARIAPQLPDGSWVTISGGNPAIWQRELPELVEGLRARGYRINIETQGSVPNDAFTQAELVTISPKGPTSGMSTDYAKLDRCIAQANGGATAVLKFVIGNDDDFVFAQETAARYPHVPVYVQPLTIGTPDDRSFPSFGELCDRVANTAALSEWRVIPQLHVLAWGGARGR